jgi:uncharacterized membrane protein
MNADPVPAKPLELEQDQITQNIEAVLAFYAREHQKISSSQRLLERLAEQRAHLDLKVTLLTEQKAAKLINLLEELRRDLPNVKNRHDPGAASLQEPMNPDLVLAALDEAQPPGPEAT